MENDKRPITSEIDGVPVQIDPETGEVLGLADAPADVNLQLGRLARVVAYCNKRVDELERELKDQLTIEPDLKQIKALLGGGMTVDGFKLEGGEAEFKFRKEG